MNRPAPYWCYEAEPLKSGSCSLSKRFFFYDGPVENAVRLSERPESARASKGLYYPSHLVNISEQFHERTDSVVFF